MRKDKGSDRNEATGTLSLVDFIQYLEGRGERGVRYVYIKGNGSKLQIEFMNDLYFGRRNGFTK
mgnify:CR=1 FL=1